MERVFEEGGRTLPAEGFRIGGISIPPGGVLAPMAGITDLPFRILCRRYGAGLVVSEMVSAEGLIRNQRGSRVLLATDGEERPAAFQLFGSRPASVARAAEILCENGADIVDINMGCPVRKVVSKGAGSALMREPGRAREIMRLTVAASSVPVTVKIRSGWDYDSINAVSFARMAEDEGIAGITVHARTSRQLFGGSVDVGIIRAVKDAVTIPVIGNGDVKRPEDIAAMMSMSGCDAVMIGRAALGNPWIFQGRGRPDDPAERFPAFREIVALLLTHADPRVVDVKAIKHAQWFAKGLPGAAEFRSSLYRDRPDVHEVLARAEAFFTGQVARDRGG